MESWSHLRLCILIMFFRLRNRWTAAFIQFFYICFIAHFHFWMLQSWLDARDKHSTLYCLLRAFAHVLLRTSCMEPWTSEEIARNTTCWGIFCTEPQPCFFSVCAENTNIRPNDLHIIQNRVRPTCRRDVPVPSKETCRKNELYQISSSCTKFPAQMIDHDVSNWIEKNVRLNS